MKSKRKTLRKKMGHPKLVSKLLNYFVTHKNRKKSSTRGSTREAPNRHEAEGLLRAKVRFQSVGTHVTWIS